MNMTIRAVPFEQKHILRNMLELYFYDCSEFDDEGLDLNEGGLYGYNWLDYYWTEEGRFAYFLKIDNKLAGFALVRTACFDPLTFEIAEFFVMRKYRKMGAGAALSERMFELHRGNWAISTLVTNSPAINFWRGVVKSVSGNNFEESLIYKNGRVEWRFCNV